VFSAEEAARLGLVNRVVPGPSLLPETLAFAEMLAAKPPLTVSAALAAFHRGLDASIDDGLAIEQAEFARIVSTNDAREGVGAFIENGRRSLKGGKRPSS
jgi:enoyl-CoA hydratase/carnithine racemase